MTTNPNFGRRLHDFNPAQAAVEILRACPLTPQDFKAVVNALVLRAAAYDQEGWYGMDSVEAGLLEAANCLEEVRGPGWEKRDDEEVQRQRELRAFMFEGYR